MSLDFRCLEFDKNEKRIELVGKSSATGISGFGMGGIFLTLPRDFTFIPAAEFCAIIRYFLENYDLEGDGDSRLSMIKLIKKAKIVEGYGKKSKRIAL
jgi:hypothetical protein